MRPRSSCLAKACDEQPRNMPGPVCTRISRGAQDDPIRTGGMNSVQNWTPAHGDRDGTRGCLIGCDVPAAT